MAERFLHISCMFKEPLDKERGAEMRLVFDKAIDWMRYGSNCWIVYTNSTTDKWYYRLRDVMRANEMLFIVEIDVSSAQGLLRTWMWRWLQFDRSERRTVGDAIIVDQKQAILPR
jgi:hypothetical protein